MRLSILSVSGFTFLCFILFMSCKGKRQVEGGELDKIQYSKLDSAEFKAYKKALIEIVNNKKDSLYIDTFFTIRYFKFYCSHPFRFEFNQSSLKLFNIEHRTDSMFVEEFLICCFWDNGFSNIKTNVIIIDGQLIDSINKNKFFTFSDFGIDNNLLSDSFKITFSNMLLRLRTFDLRLSINYDAASLKYVLNFKDPEVLKPFYQNYESFKKIRDFYNYRYSLNGDSAVLNFFMYKVLFDFRESVNTQYLNTRRDQIRELIIYNHDSVDSYVYSAIKKGEKYVEIPKSVIFTDCYNHYDSISFLKYKQKQFNKNSLKLKQCDENQIYTLFGLGSVLYFVDYSCDTVSFKAIVSQSRYGFSATLSQCKYGLWDDEKKIELSLEEYLKKYYKL